LSATEVTDPALTQNEVLMGEQAYAAAIDRVIAEAKQTLLIFDQDFSVGDFGSINRFDAISAFLKNSPSSTLTIILQDTERFTTQLPKLLQLLGTYGHKMSVYETNSHAKIAKDCFILADKQSYVRRFHIDQARFKFTLEDIETTASLGNRFDALMQETTNQLSTNTLGL